MQVDVTEYLNSTYSSSSATEEASNELGQDTFLELLCTQLQWQDPLEPMEDTDMVAQLAQFSSLESLEEISEGMGTVAELLENQTLLSATSYLGKDVEASGSSMSKDGDVVSTVSYTLSEDASSVWAHVVTTDGDIVASVDLLSQDAGDHTFVWDGLDSSGDEAEDGQYALAFSAEDAGGEEIYVSAMVTGTVNEVFTKDGSTYLGLDDGRMVNLLNVTRVVDVSQAAETEES